MRLAINTAFKRAQRRLALAATHERVQTILKIAQDFGYFNVFATVEEAEAAII